MLIPFFHSGLGLPHVLALAALLFCLGLFGVMTHRNALRALMSLELMLGAVTLNLGAFAAFLHPEGSSGLMLAAFIAVTGAAELAVALAIVLLAWRARGSMDLETFDRLRG